MQDRLCVSPFRPLFLALLYIYIMLVVFTCNIYSEFVAFHKSREQEMAFLK